MHAWVAHCIGCLCGLQAEVSEWSPALAEYTDKHLVGYFREHPASIKMFTNSINYLCMLDWDNRGFDRFC